MRCASVIGYHGMENFGDDLFLEITTDLLVQHLQVKHIYLSARDIPDTLAQTAAQLIPMYPARRRIKRIDWLSQLRAALKSDLVVFSAGSIFAGPQFRQLALLTRTLKMADRLRGKNTHLIGLGISLGPFSRDKDRHLIARGLVDFHTLLLRDQSSVDEAACMDLPNAELSQDLVPLLAERLLTRWAQIQKQTAPNVVILGLSLGPGFHHWTQPEWVNFGHQLGTQLSTMQEQPDRPTLELRIFTTCNSATDGDRAISAALQQVLQRPSLTIRRIDYCTASRDTFIDALLGCHGLISSRLHPALVAMGTGIPVLQLSATSPKITGVYKRIGLQPIALTRELLPQPQQWHDFLSAMTGDGKARIAKINADNQSAFRQAGADCAARLEQLFTGFCRRPRT